MSDQKLLELAAKAAGIKHNPSLSAACRGERIWWNPLINDGDALRLAARLQIDVLYDGFIVFAEWENPHAIDREQVYETLGTDPYAATRHAIVRAAAEIGRAM